VQNRASTMCETNDEAAKPWNDGLSRQVGNELVAHSKPDWCCVNGPSKAPC
jgi:hypothetical protein